MLYHTLESINSKFPSPPGASLPNLLKGKENTSPLESRKVVMLSISGQTKDTETNPGLCFQFFLTLEWIWSFWEARMPLPVTKYSFCISSARSEYETVAVPLSRALTPLKPILVGFGRL